MTVQRVLRENSAADLIRWSYRRALGTVTGPVRLLPDFIVIGAQRCGTTSLFNYLSQHPEVYPAFPKEVHYFSNHYQKGMNWYRSHFPYAWQKRRISANGHKFVTGEATPYYLSHPHAPKRVAEALPKVQLIVLMRNPVERAYSHYQHEVKMGVESLTFEEAIDKEEERLAVDFNRLLNEDDYRSFNHQHYTYLSRGIYADQLLAWRRYFDQAQFLILVSERLYEYPALILKQVCSYLGMTEMELAEYKQYRSTQYRPMEDATRKRLVQFYQPHNQRLFEYLGETIEWR